MMNCQTFLILAMFVKPTLLKNISFTDIFLNNSPTPFGTIFNITSLSDCLEERILSQDQCLIFRHPLLRWRYFQKMNNGKQLFSGQYSVFISMPWSICKKNLKKIQPWLSVYYNNTEGWDKVRLSSANEIKHARMEHVKFVEDSF